MSSIYMVHANFIFWVDWKYYKCNDHDIFSVRFVATNNAYMNIGLNWNDCYCVILHLLYVRTRSVELFFYWFMLVFHFSYAICYGSSHLKPYWEIFLNHLLGNMEIWAVWILWYRKCGHANSKLGELKNMGHGQLVKLVLKTLLVEYLDHVAKWHYFPIVLLRAARNWWAMLYKKVSIMVRTAVWSHYWAYLDSSMGKILPGLCLQRQD